MKKITFKEFLAEIMMDVDVTDPNSAVKQVKTAARVGPERAARAQAIAAKAQDQIDRETGAEQSPTDAQLNRTKQQMLLLQQKKAREDRAKQQTAM